MLVGLGSVRGIKFALDAKRETDTKWWGTIVRWNEERWIPVYTWDLPFANFDSLLDITRGVMFTRGKELVDVTLTK
jgi:hypothetical protein